ncbi:MAG: radical SAM family heme chaperone HemW [Candidatus Izemoplasmatales bacterium]|nr:radical SAM family heme chaperone HemW [Candidatus Izemoplasmatales bacterium]
MIKGLYIHIPFCENICTYCDFPKMVASEKLQYEYLNALIIELIHYQSEYQSLETIYIGGGTPSFLNQELLQKVLHAIDTYIDLSKIKEFTIEANPKDVNENFVKLIKKHHVNRLSIGMQTSHVGLLKTIGRNHTSQDIKSAIDICHKHNLYNINIDIIYAIPGENVYEVASDLQFVFSLKPTHISIYSLILEEKTKLYFDYTKGIITLVDEDTEFRMANVINSLMIESGYIQYEISNYSLPGFESKHNLGYWNLEEYLGIGMGASSQFDGCRFVNHKSLHMYLEQIIKSSTGIMSEEDFNPRQETILLGLRKKTGVSLADFEAVFHQTIFEAYPELEHFIDLGLLHKNSTHLFLTDKGIMLSNQVFLSLF